MYYNEWRFASQRWKVKHAKGSIDQNIEKIEHAGIVLCRARTQMGNQDIDAMDKHLTDDLF